MSARRDFKHRAAGQPRRRTRRQALVVGVLVLVGLAGAALAWLSGYGPRPAPAPQAQAPRPAPAPAPPAPEPSKPKYDFYTVLPDRQVVIPADELQERESRKLQLPAPPARPAQPPQPAAAQPGPAQSTGPTPARPGDGAAPAGGGYLVQAGAFRNYRDADRMRASLALLGVSARIVSAADTGLHRVRVGPLSEPEARTLRRRLQEKGIQSISFKAD